MIWKVLESMGLPERTVGSFPWFLAVLFGGILVVAATVVVSAPIYCLVVGRERVGIVARALEQKVFTAFFTGLGVALLAIGLLFASSKLGFAGIAVGVLVSGALWLLLSFGYAGISLWLTNALAPNGKTIWWVCVGAGLVTMLQVIPMAGILFVAFFVPVACGAAVLSVLAERTGGQLQRSAKTTLSEDAGYTFREK